MIWPVLVNLSCLLVNGTLLLSNTLPDSSRQCVVCINFFGVVVSSVGTGICLARLL